MLKFIYLKVDTDKFPQVKVQKIKLNCNNFQKTQVINYACDRIKTTSGCLFSVVMNGPFSVNLC